MDNQTGFYVLGIALVLAALVVAALGLRKNDFPSPLAMRGVTALFAALVIGTATYAVLYSREEAEHRENEEAAALEEAAGEAAGVAEADEPEGPPPGAPAPTGSPQSSTLKLTSPADGGLSYDPAQLSAKAGELTIDYTNPSRVDHDVVLERNGEAVGKSDLIADDTASLAALVEPGEYTFFCDVPGHREGGMEGTLTVE